MLLSEKIRILRENNEWTQAQLAAKLCLSESAIQKWEKGKNTPPLGALRDISRLFLLSLEELLDENKIIYNYFLLYETEVPPRCGKPDSPHKVYDANLKYWAKLHRFNTPGGTPYSAIYRGSYEFWSCEREREMNMIKYWNEEFKLS